VNNRREFLKQLALGTAYAAVPGMFAGTVVTPDDKLDQICWRIGEFSRERNLRPAQVIATDQCGRLVVAAKNGHHFDKEDGFFHIADREGKYSQLGYRVEDRCLARADKLSVFVHTENGCHSFPLVFARGLRPVP
jgi:hypothetical protein